MKKFIIGTVVLGMLIVYSLGIRHEQPKISAPTQLAIQKTVASSSSNLKSTSQAISRKSQSTVGGYRDGMYTGSVQDASYGDVQVSVNIKTGKIAAVTFLKYPNTHSTSVYINNQAMPYLQQEVIKAQGTNVNIISGATYTSQAFIQSLNAALLQAT